eukprot:g15464.t1
MRWPAHSNQAKLGPAVEDRRALEEATPKPAEAHAHDASSDTEPALAVGDDGNDVEEEQEEQTNDNDSDTSTKSAKSEAQSISIYAMVKQWNKKLDELADMKYDVHGLADPNTKDVSLTSVLNHLTKADRAEMNRTAPEVAMFMFEVMFTHWRTAWFKSEMKEFKKKHTSSQKLLYTKWRQLAKIGKPALDDKRKKEGKKLPSEWEVALSQYASAPAAPVVDHAPSRTAQNERAANTETANAKPGSAPSPDRKPVTDRTTKEQATEEWTQKRDDLLKNKSGIRLPSDLKTGDITVTKAMKSLESLANKADDTDSEEEIAPEVKGYQD